MTLKHSASKNPVIIPDIHKLYQIMKHYCEGNSLQGIKCECDQTGSGVLLIVPTTKVSTRKSHTFFQGCDLSLRPAANRTCTFMEGGLISCIHFRFEIYSLGWCTG